MHPLYIRTVIVDTRLGKTQRRNTNPPSQQSLYWFSCQRPVRIQHHIATRQIKQDENYDFASSPIFGGPQRMVNKAPRPKNMGRGPMTEKGRMNLDFSIPGYTPYDKAYNPSDEEILQIYRNQGIVPATFGGKLQPGEGTKVRMGLASQGDNRSIYGNKFMEGGIASLNVKK